MVLVMMGGTIRDIDTVLEESRKAIGQINASKPYILLPHSMSGIEALYWVQKYPSEIKSIIGLDMATPENYENMKMVFPLVIKKIMSFCSKSGIFRLFPKITEVANELYRVKNSGEKKINDSITHRRNSTRAMVNECYFIKDNAIKVQNIGVSDIPMLIFVSNGSGGLIAGTGYDKEGWRKFSEEFVKDKKNSKRVLLECAHTLHDIDPEIITNEIEKFIEKINEKN